jgi:hypothetical protein
LPSECKGKSGQERRELEKCPGLSERESATSPEGCNIPPTPDPPGCVRLEILSGPPLDARFTLEGYVEPLESNGGPNGLNPSSLSFEGHSRGEPGLHLRETPTTEYSATGSIKIDGYSSQELMAIK